MTITPISPEQAFAQKHTVLPDKVLEIVNRLILKHLVNGVATFKQAEVVSALVDQGHSRNEIFDNCWLDFEDAYRAAGWDVDYDKPAYNESYDATFTFKIKRGR